MSNDDTIIMSENSSSSSNGSWRSDGSSVHQYNNNHYEDVHIFSDDDDDDNNNNNSDDDDNDEDEILSEVVILQHDHTIYPRITLRQAVGIYDHYQSMEIASNNDSSSFSIYTSSSEEEEEEAAAAAAADDDDDDENETTTNNNNNNYPQLIGFPLLLLNLPETLLTHVLQFLDLSSLKACQRFPNNNSVLDRHLRNRNATEQAIWIPMYQKLWPWLLQQQQQEQQQQSLSSSSSSSYWCTCNIQLQDEKSTTTTTTATRTMIDHASLLSLASTVGDPTCIDEKWIVETLQFYERNNIDPNRWMTPRRSLSSQLSETPPLLQLIECKINNNCGSNNNNNNNINKTTTTTTTIVKAVQFTGIVGISNRSVRANKPLPKPLLRQKKQIIRYKREEDDEDEEEIIMKDTEFFHSILPNHGELPFVVPFRTCCSSNNNNNNDNDNNKRIFQVTPRFIAYFEISIAASPLQPQTREDEENDSDNDDESIFDNMRRGRQTSSSTTTLLRRRQQRRHYQNDCIAIGVVRGAGATTNSNSNSSNFVQSLRHRLPGWDSSSIGYHSDNGRVYQGSGHGQDFGPSFGPGDTVGCGVDYLHHAIFFTFNGRLLNEYNNNNNITKPRNEAETQQVSDEGVNNDVIMTQSTTESTTTTTTTRRLNCDYLWRNYANLGHPDFYPVVGLDSQCPVAFNFGIDRPFCFDLTNMIQAQREYAVTRLQCVT